MKATRLGVGTRDRDCCSRRGLTYLFRGYLFVCYLFVYYLFVCYLFVYYLFVCYLFICYLFVCYLFVGCSLVCRPIRSLTCLFAVGSIDCFETYLLIRLSQCWWPYLASILLHRV